MPQSRSLSREEFDAIYQRVAEAAPEGISREGFGRYFPPALEAALGEAENSPAPLEGSAVERFAAGAWRNLNPMNLIGAAIHPAETAKAIIAAHRDQLEKAQTAYQDGRYTEAVGHLAAGALPLIGPAAAHAGEAIAGGDVAGGLGEGAGLLAPIAARAARKPIGRGMTKVGEGVEALAESKPAKYAAGGGAIWPLMRGDLPKAAMMAIAPKAIGVAGRALQVGGQVISGDPLLGSPPPDAGPPAPPLSPTPLELTRQNRAAWQAAPEHAPAAASAAPGPTIAAGPTPSPQMIRNLLGIAARRARVDLTPEVETAAGALMQDGATAEASLQQALSAGKTMLSAGESKLVAAMLRRGASDAEVAAAVKAARAFNAKFGLSTPTPAETRFPKGMRGGSRPLGALEP